MKTFVILFTLFYFLNALAVAPYGIKGQQNGATLYSNVHQFPNNQVTNLGGINALVETGNKNILSNPSFEAPFVSSLPPSWANSAGTITAETSIVMDGKSSVKVALAAQTLSLTQSSTLYQAQFADGVQGLASVWLKSNVALKVCSIQAGTVSTTNCVDVQANNKWGLYKVPFILGATSNGISIASTGAVSGTVYIDDAFVGAASLTQNMIACNSISCETLFNATISTAGVVSKTNYSGWVTSSAGATGQYTITFPVGQFSSAPSCQCNNDDGNTRGCAVTSVTTTGAGVTTYVNGNTTANAPFNIICERVGADYTAAKQLSNGNTYSSTNADTDWASCGHTAASFTGLGSVINIETQCKRQGSDLLMKGRFTAGIPTAVEARLALPTWNGVQLVSAGTSVIPSLQLSGDMIYSASSTINFRHATLIEPSVSYMTFAYQSSTNAAFQKILGTTMTANNQNFSFSSRIPIEGWQNSNILIGQFNGLESCSDTYQCTDVFSAQISATGTVIAGSENVDWISGNCTFGTNYSCTYLTNTLKGSGQGLTDGMNCTLTTDNSTTAASARVISSTTSGVSFQGLTTAGAETSAQTRIVCQKRSADYLGKTAKAVASDQNLRTPGVVNASVVSASLSSASVVTQEIGDFLNSCSCSAGSYTCTFNTNFWQSAPICTIGNPDIRLRFSFSINETISSLTWQVQDANANGYCLQQDIVCHGVIK